MIVQRLHDETSHPLSALVVDGNRTSTRQLNAVLEEHPRITVRCAAKTIASAQIQLARHRPDVIFVDVSVAQGAGLAAVARLFASGQAIVVVADRPDFACEAFEFGAVDYLLKPVQEQRLQATLIRIDRFFWPLESIVGERGLRACIHAAPVRRPRADPRPALNHRRNDRRHAGGERDLGRVLAELFDRAATGK